MPVLRTPISVSQISELLGIDPKDFVAMERASTGWCIVTEGRAMNTSGSFPQLNQGGKRIGTKKSKGKKG